MLQLLAVAVAVAAMQGRWEKRCFRTATACCNVTDIPASAFVTGSKFIALCLVGVKQSVSATVRPESVVGTRPDAHGPFIDYLRNGRSASTVASFSVRARPGMAVSIPISWHESKDVKSGDQWTMAQAIHRQRILAADPWEGYWRTRQGITVAMRRAVGMKR